MGSAVTPIARGTYVGAKGLQGLVKGGVQGQNTALEKLWNPKHLRH